MNIAPVSMSRLLMALIRPMPMKASRQEDSAAASSERAAGCDEREGERGINCFPLFFVLCTPQPSCPSRICSCVNDEAVMRIDGVDVDLLAGIYQRIVATRDVLDQLLKLRQIDRRMLTAALGPHHLLDLLQLIAVRVQEIVQLGFFRAGEALHEVGRNAVD